MSAFSKALTIFILAATSIAAVASEIPKAGSIPLSKMALTLENKGYTLSEASFESTTEGTTYWEFDVFKSGKTLEITVDPTTAAILTFTPDRSNGSAPKAGDKALSEIATSLEKLGYHITEADYSPIHWEFEAIKDNQKWELTVSTETGIILTKKKE